jgi:hypothetical protein
MRPLTSHRWVCLRKFTLALVQVPRMVQKVNGKLLTVTQWLGQLVGGILPRIPGLDPRTLYCSSLSKLTLFFENFGIFLSLSFHPFSILIFLSSTLLESIRHSHIQLAFRLSSTHFAFRYVTAANDLLTHTDMTSDQFNLVRFAWVVHCNTGSSYCQKFKWKRSPSICLCTFINRIVEPHH